MPTKNQLEKASWQWTETTAPDSVTDEHIHLAYRIGLPSCHPKICRRNCKGNPNCLVGLGEKEWLCDINEDRWHEVEDPDLERRAKDAFVGLKNLGATCYVNTFLQVWFHNHSFRAAMYKWRPLSVNSASVGHSQPGVSDSDQPAYTPTCICGHLQLLFALLQFTNRRYIDPSGLVNCLGLDAALQQDAQEFSKLFMSLLEETLSLQTHPDVRNVIQQQFCGQYAYVTRCSNCGHSSERPSKFYELDLNIKDHRELSESLGEFLQEEHLEGANQYFCDGCRSKQNATRRIQLLQLPPVLNIQLLRFIFDRQTGTKKKLNSFIQFPEVLDLTQYLPRKDTETIYELTAVLIHRGPTAYSGHYVAHIQEQGAWHKFNDEEVERMEGKNLKLGSEDDLQERGPKQGKRPKNTKGFHSSKNAYMLVYKRRTQEAPGNNSEPEEPVLAEHSLPAYLQDLIRRDRLNFEQWTLDMASMRDKCIASGKAKHKEITQLYLMLPPQPGGPYEWLPSDWLKQWLSADSNASCQPIDNSNLVCNHGNLDPDRIHGIKRISHEAAEVLFLKYGGGPRLTGDSLCPECVRETCHLMRLKSRLAEDCKFVANATKNKHGPGLPGFWIGKASLKNWRRMVLKKEEQGGVNLQDPSKEDDLQEQGDTSDQAIDEGSVFNGELLCSHNCLSTDESVRKLVPTEVWERLCTYFPGSPEFSQDKDACPICQASDEEERQNSMLRVTMAADQKAILPHLFNDKQRPSWDKKDMMEAFAVSRPFLEQWREFIRQPLKNTLPSDVNNSLLLCDHNLFLFEPSVTDELTANMYSLIWPQEWQILAQNFTVDCTIRMYREEVTTEGTISQTLKCKPESCMECITARQNRAKLEKQEYSGARIYIRKIVNELNSIGQSLTATDDRKGPSDGTNKDPDFFQVNGNKKLKLSADADSIRRSSRHRKVRGEKEVIVSSSNTLKELKIKVMHAFSVAPFDQTLLLGGQQLTDNDSTLSSLGIEPGCVITLTVDMPQSEDILVMDEIFRASNVPEAGFKGTGLIGGGN